MIGDYRTPDRLRLGPAALYVRFTDVWDAMEQVREITAEKSYADIPAEQSRVT